MRSVLELRHQPQRNLHTVLVERTLAVAQPSSEVVAVPLVPPEVVVEVVPPLGLEPVLLVQEQVLPLGQVLLVQELALVLAPPLAELRHS